MKSSIHTHDVPMLVLRIAVGIIFIVHGWQKVSEPAKFSGFFMMQHFPAFMVNVVGYVELVAGVLVLLGLWTSIAAVPLAIIIATALFYVKGGAVFRAFNVPVFELDLLLLASLVVIFCKGSGKYAIKPSGCLCCKGGNCNV